MQLLITNTGTKILLEDCRTTNNYKDYAGAEIFKDFFIDQLVSDGSEGREVPNITKPGDVAGDTLAKLEFTGFQSMRQRFTSVELDILVKMDPVLKPTGIAVITYHAIDMLLRFFDAFIESTAELWDNEIIFPAGFQSKDEFDRYMTRLRDKIKNLTTLEGYVMHKIIWLLKSLGNKKSLISVSRKSVFDEFVKDEDFE